MKRLVFIIAVMLAAISSASAFDFNFYWPWIKSNIDSNNAVSTNAITSLSRVASSSTGYVSKASAHVWNVSFPTTGGAVDTNGILSSLPTGTWNTASVNATSWTNWAKTWTNWVITNGVSILGNTNAITVSNHMMYVWFNTNSSSVAASGGDVWKGSNQVFTGVNGFSNAVDIYSQSWPSTNSYAYRLFTYDMQSSSFSTNDIGTNVNLLLHANGTNASTWFPDSSTNNVCTIVANGGTHVTNDTKFGSGSAYFDGTGDYFSCTNQIEWDFRTGDWSVEFWMKPDGAQVAFFGLVGAINNANAGWSIASRDGNMKPDFYFSGWKLAGAGAIPLNVWTHLAYARVGNTLKVFTNGVVDGTLDVTGYDFNSSQTLAIGRFYNNTDDYYFKGNLDEIIISKGVSRYTNAFIPYSAELGVGATTTNSSYYLYAIGPDGSTNQLAPSVSSGSTVVDTNTIVGIATNFSYQAMTGMNYATKSDVTNIVNGITNSPGGWVGLSNDVYSMTLRTSLWNLAFINSTSWTNWWNTNSVQAELSVLQGMTNGWMVSSNQSAFASNGVVVLNSQTNSFVTTNDNRFLNWTNADIRVKDSRTGTNANNPVVWRDWVSGNDPLGFPDSQVGSWSQSFTFASLTFTNHLLATSADIYHKGHKVTFTNSQSIVISSANGAHYIYYDDYSGTLKESTIPWNFSNVVQVALVYKNDGQAFLANELHGTSMPWIEHERGHAQGPLVKSGFDGLIAATTGFSFNSGIWFDEDIRFTMPIQNQASVVTHTNSTTMNWTAPQNLPYLTNSAGRILFDNGSITQEVQNGYYTAMWLVAADSWPNGATFAIVGQREDSDITSCRNNSTWSSLNLTGYPSQEIRPLYRLIYHRQGANLVYDEAADFRTDRFGAIGSSASSIPNISQVLAAGNNMAGQTMTNGGLSNVVSYGNFNVTNGVFMTNGVALVLGGSGSQTNVLGVEYANNAGSLTGFSVSAYGTVSNNSLIGLTNLPPNWATVSNNTAIMAASSNNWNIGVTNQPPNWIAVSNGAMLAKTIVAGAGLSSTISGDTNTLVVTNKSGRWYEFPNNTNSNYQIAQFTNTGVAYSLSMSNELPSNVTAIMGMVAFNGGAVNQVLRLTTPDHAGTPSGGAFMLMGPRVRCQTLGVFTDVGFVMPCTNKTIYYSLANSTNIPLSPISIMIYGYYQEYP